MHRLVALPCKRPGRLDPTILQRPGVDANARTTFAKALGMTLGLALIAGCSEPPPSSTATRTPQVTVATATTGPAAPPIRAHGMLANRDEVQLSFKVGGIISELNVREGQQVKRGQRLASIEQTEVEASVEQARQAHGQAQRDLQRGERLYADQVITLEQLEGLRTQEAVAAASLRAARFNQGHATIIAPLDGTVLRRLAEERELVGAGMPVLVLGGQEQGYIVRVGLADRQVVQVQLGDEAQARLDALPGAPLQGKVTEIASAADPRNGLFNVEVTLEGGDAALRSGLVASVDILPTTARASERVYLPIGALVQAHGLQGHVFVLENDSAQRRDIDIAFISGSQVALNAGVQAGEAVIVDGARYLREGDAVTVITTDASR